MTLKTIDPFLSEAAFTARSPCVTHVTHQLQHRKVEGMQKTHR